MTFVRVSFYDAKYNTGSSSSLEQSKLTNDRLREPKNIFHVYRVLQIQVKDGNQVYGAMIVGGKVLLFLLAVYCTYGAIRLSGIMAIALGIVGISSTEGVPSYSGQFLNDISEHLKRQFKVLKFCI